MNRKETHIFIGLFLVIIGIVVLVTESDPYGRFHVPSFTGLFFLIVGVGLFVYGLIFGVFKESGEIYVIKNMICPKCQDVIQVNEYKGQQCGKCSMNLLTLDDFLNKKEGASRKHP